MKPDQLDQMLAKASRSVQLLNKHLARVCPAHADYVEPEKPKSKKRIRQDSKPLLNKLETDALNHLQQTYPSAVFHKQALRVKIANGAWYKPDLCMCNPDTGRWTAWEVKELRGKNVDRGVLVLKCAAHQFPEVRWKIIWRDKVGPWHEQEILS